MKNAWRWTRLLVSRSVLLKLAEGFGGEPVPNNVQVPIKMSQQDLADLVGVARVLANGKLKAWEHDGILSHRSGQLTLHGVRTLR
ncbi:MAG: winged helix-turn-helix domain-containing protein [Polyangiaceae bacterium]|nr:winged helix-turn-helix domain-containing protein [Polyangiaceae bacterium]